MIHCLLLVTSLLAGQVETPAGKSLKSEVRRLVRQLDACATGPARGGRGRIAQTRPGDPRSAAAAERSAVGRGAAAVGPHPAEVAAAGGRRRRANRRRSRSRPTPCRLRRFWRSSRVSRAIRSSTIAASSATAKRKCPSPDLKVHFDKTPFWPALDQVLDQAGLTVYPFAERGEKAAISVTSRFPNKLPSISRSRRVGRACYSGPFRFEVVSVVARRDFRPQRAGSLSVNVEIAWEPRLRIIGLSQRMADVKAVDEKRQTAVRSPTPRPNSRFPPAARPRPSRLTCRFGCRRATCGGSPASRASCRP